ncbi:MAG: DHHA1 domain-containing protein [Chloroflexota bacterium]
MNHPAYYNDAYTTHFESTILEFTEYDGRPAVVLEQTYFYPTSGGQPHDTGRLIQTGITMNVLEIVERKIDNAILHIVDIPPGSGTVRGEIDWPRRFDHMQHHTGQHILSQAFIRVAAAETVGFHLSEQRVTIDLEHSNLTDDQLQAAEQLANEIVWENRSVHIREVRSEEAGNLPLRKIPPARDGHLRLINVDNFDLTACGGTHVDRTGAVGLIKIVKTEHRGTITRIEFCCGRRAIEDYRLKHEVINDLSSYLTTGYSELVPSVLRLRDEAKQLRQELKRQQKALLELEAQQLVEKSESLGSLKLVKSVFPERGVDEVRLLGNSLASQIGVIALLGIYGNESKLIFCRSADAPGVMGDIIHPALERLGSARGGGGPAFAQGGGPPADMETVTEAIALAEQRLREVLNGIE